MPPSVANRALSPIGCNERASKTSGEPTRAMHFSKQHDDWRITNQDRYLLDATLTWKTWSPRSDNPSWDHDHCEFCWQKISNLADPDFVPAGFCATDRHCWVCRQCYDDFKGRFRWIVTGNPPAQG